MKKNLNSLVWGIGLIAAGILFALNIAGIIDFNIWADIWPLAIALAGITIVLDNKKNIIGYLITALGIFWFLKNQFDLNFNIRYFFAIFLIFAGIVIIYNIFIKTDNTVNSSKSKLNQFTAFSGRNDRITCGEYYGTNTLCIFGGHEIDLREYVFHNDVVINATALFGGVDIIIPKNVNIIIKSMPLFGGVENKCENTGNNPYTVYVNATAIFGGVELKNWK